jgi:hypothetical protein
MKEHEQEGRDDFWTERTPLFTAQFPAYYSEPQKVCGRFHTSEEQYHASLDEEIIPIKEKKGSGDPKLAIRYSYLPASRC